MEKKLCVYFMFQRILCPLKIWRKKPQTFSILIYGQGLTTVIWSKTWKLVWELTFGEITKFGVWPPIYGHVRKNKDFVTPFLTSLVILMYVRLLKTTLPPSSSSRRSILRNSSSTTKGRHKKILFRTTTDFCWHGSKSICLGLLVWTKYFSITSRM